jgi:hypothetical protein
MIILDPLGYAELAKLKTVDDSNQSLIGTVSPRAH